MQILSFKPGHDGQIAHIKDGCLDFSIEAEKDSGARYSPINYSTMLASFPLLDAPPDVIALSGWTADFHNKTARPVGAGYNGHSGTAISVGETRWLGRSVQTFSSSHERSHLMCAYGLSPFPQGRPCYALLWESEFGSIYHIDEKLGVTKLADVLKNPGLRYSMLYAIGDASFRGRFRMEDAGKLMALAGHGKRGKPTLSEKLIIDRLLTSEIDMNRFEKKDFIDTLYYNVGLLDPIFTNLARRFSDRIFQLFLEASDRLSLDRHLPLLIAGGCGLNCEWNSAWRDSGRFQDVFVPPCCNDSGSAIGTAIDAQFYFSGNAKLQWSVYSGEDFIFDIEDLPGFSREQLSTAKVASLLASEKVVAWVQGRYEIGPRALGNRSLLASPFTDRARKRLNSIKAREDFRPIAPICLEDDFDKHFTGKPHNPYMLFFNSVKDERLKAVMHVDGSARAQTVSITENARMHDLLRSFRDITGVGVLCNTSLNFRGAGFINRLSDLHAYAEQVKIDVLAVGDRLYSKDIY